MAIYHFSQKLFTRGAGRNAVNCAAYRRGARLHDSASGETFDYTRKKGVEHSELTVPADAPAWLREIAARDDSAALWSAVEAHEKRKDARLAKEIELALPRELDRKQQLDLVRTFVVEQLAARGMVADWSVHNPSNGENPHVHIMLTTRPVTEQGFGARSVPILNPETGEHLRDEKGRLRYQFGDTWGTVELLNELREGWADYQNRHLARAGHGVRVDHRSLAEQGISTLPMLHVGVHAASMADKGKRSDRVDTFLADVSKNAAEISARPAKLLETVITRKAVFTRDDLARELGRWVNDPQQFQTILARALEDAELVQLAPEKRTESGWVLEPARYSTRGMLEAEARMLADADALAADRSHAVKREHIAKAFAAREYLSEEQRAAVQHLVDAQGLAAVAGFAGAGKSSALAAAREAWQASGYRVRGAALAGKAADGLHESAGIESSTIHALEKALERGKEKLDARSVLVIDEAGMVGSRQLGRVLEHARKAGAKVVLVGDAQQLQPIEAGAAFRAISERVGVTEIATIRRQNEEWARQASYDFARGKVKEGLLAYDDRECVHLVKSREQAKAELARRWMAERDPKRPAIILAHTNDDVRDLNQAVRAARRTADELGTEARFETKNGPRDFAALDRVVFLQNDRGLGVKNGTLGTVMRADQGRLVVKLDSGRTATVSEEAYAALDHGYAVTVHKAQGVTVDRAYVLASAGMDRHLAYVAMTRHRDQVQLFAGEDDFRNLDAMAARLGRARPKESSLDFAERRGIDPATPSSSLEDAKAVAELERKRIPAKVPVHSGKSPGALGQPKAPAASVQKPTASAAAAKPQEPSTPATSPPRVETPEQKHRRELIEMAVRQAQAKGLPPERIEEVRAAAGRSLDERLAAGKPLPPVPALTREEKAAETMRKYREKMERDREEEKDKGRER